MAMTPRTRRRQPKLLDSVDLSSAESRTGSVEFHVSLDETDTAAWEKLVAASLIWIVSCTATGYGLAFVGPGAVTVIVCALLGCIGAVVHIATHLVGVKLRWWYAGMLIAAVTTAFLSVSVGGDLREPTLAAFLFVIFTVVATAVFPIAHSVMPKLFAGK